MRQAIMVTLLAGFCMLTMRCSDKESISHLSGRSEIKSAAIDTMFYVLGPDSVSNGFSVHLDSILWVYKVAEGEDSRVDLILRGMSQLDLSIDTFRNGQTGARSLARDSIGEFVDTVTIASYVESGVFLTQGSRLFVRIGELVLDTFALVNPRSR